MVIMSVLKLVHIILLIINAVIYNVKIVVGKLKTSALNATMGIFYLLTTNAFNAIILGFI